jgi:hypothetical protein
MIDISKPYTTRAGWKAGAMLGPDGNFYGWVETPSVVIQRVWNSKGRVFRDSLYDLHPDDLVNVPEQRSVKGWAALREGEKPTPWQSVDIYTGAPPDKDTRKVLNILAMREVELTFTIGEGLGDKP